MNSDDPRMVILAHTCPDVCNRTDATMRYLKQDVKGGEFDDEFTQRVDAEGRKLAVQWGVPVYRYEAKSCFTVPVDQTIVNKGQG